MIVEVGIVNLDIDKNKRDRAFDILVTIGSLDFLCEFKFDSVFFLLLFFF